MLKYFYKGMHCALKHCTHTKDKLSTNLAFPVSSSVSLELGMSVDDAHSDWGKTVNGSLNWSPGDVTPPDWTSEKVTPSGYGWDVT